MKELRKARCVGRGTELPCSPSPPVFTSSEGLEHQLLRVLGGGSVTLGGIQSLATGEGTRALAL